MAGGITLTALSGVLNAALEHVDSDLIETQHYNRMPGVRDFVDRAETKSPTGNTHSWNIRARDAVGTVGPMKPYGTTTYVKDYYSERLTVPFRDFVSTAFVFDRLELARNRADPIRIYDLIKEARSAQMAEINKRLEEAVWGIPQNADDEDAIFGIEAWAGRSMTSAGAFVANPEGSHDGAYVAWGDGTFTATKGGRNTAALGMERTKNYVATHNSTLDQTLLEQISKAIVETDFDFADGLEGKVPQTGIPAIYWDTTFDEQYNNFLQSGSDFFYKGGTGDFYRGREKRINGVICKRTPALNGKAHRPIYGNRVANGFQCMKASGMWMVDSESVVPGAHNVMYKPRDWTWQARCMDLRTGLFLIHGE